MKEPAKTVTEELKLEESAPQLVETPPLLAEAPPPLFEVAETVEPDASNELANGIASTSSVSTNDNTSTSSCASASTVPSAHHTLKLLMSQAQASLKTQLKNAEDHNQNVTPRQLLRDAQHDLARLLKSNKSGYRYLFFGLFAAMALITIRTLAHTVRFAAPVRPLFEKWYREHADTFDDPQWIKSVGLQYRPVVFFALCFSPIAMMLLMLHFSIERFISAIKPKQSTITTNPNTNAVSFKQRAPKKADGPAAFFFSPLFSACLFLVFASGLPAFICFGLYNYFGIDALFGHPSHDPHFMTIFFIQGLYAMSLGWCATCLFFRAYFMFPWSFLSPEYTIEIDEYAVRKMPCKGWFADIILWSYPTYGHTLHRLKWNQITEVKITNANANKQFQTYKGLFPRLIASFAQAQQLILDESEIDGEVLWLQGKDYSDTIDIRLWELSAEERARLFVTLKKNAPNIQLSTEVQEALVGSNALSDPRYTEIWFDVLTHNMQARRTELTPGEQLHDGTFTVKERLDSGGQASIYLAQSKDGTEVILKEFHLTPGEDIGVTMDSAAAFENESSLLAQMDHPSIVKLLDIFIDSGRVYLVLEKVPGQSLRKAVKEGGPLDEEQTINLALQMTEILQYLHNQVPEIIHRDFTPDNLMLNPDGTLKLIDFSIAERRKNTTGDCAGKHSYTPPEQFRGEATSVSDLYALGATLQFLLTGKDPEPLKQSSPIESGVSVNPALDSIIKNATALESTDRCESAAWLATELKALKESTVNTKTSRPTTEMSDKPKARSAKTQKKEKSKRRAKDIL